MVCAACAALMACDTVLPIEPVPRPVARPDQPAVTALPEAVSDPGDESRLLAAYYQRVQSGLLAQGMLRRDGGGVDTPYDARQLAENFVRIALYEEYASVGGALVARATPSRLRRWDRPIRMEVEFGATVPKANRIRDNLALVKFGERLSELTGVPISQVGSRGNYHVFIVNEQERRALEPRLRSLVPDIDESTLRTVIDMDRSSYCLVFAIDAGEKGAYSQAVAVIRAEHPDLLRLSCIHEEVAQGMGLPNDSPAARPSIFNDDEEFALLTDQDELFLRMLYDPRLRPGMTPDEARPIAETIAAELLGGES